MEKQIILYGLLGADKAYFCAGAWTVFTDDISVNEIMRQARKMRAENPSIREVYMIDNRRGLRRDYTEAVKHPSVESGVLFRDILQRHGALLPD